MSQVRICSRLTKPQSGPVCVPGTERRCHMSLHSETEYLLPRTLSPPVHSIPACSKHFSKFRKKCLFQLHVPCTFPTSLYTLTLFKIFTCFVVVRLVRDLRAVIDSTSCILAALFGHHTSGSRVSLVLDSTASAVQDHARESGDMREVCFVKDVLRSPMKPTRYAGNSEFLP